MSDLLMFNEPYALWSIWRDLSTLQHLFVVILGLVCLYVLLSAIALAWRLRSAALERIADTASIRLILVTLDRRCTNVQQVIQGTFYLFGFVLFLGFQTIHRTLGDGKVPLGMEVVGNFILHCAFAANVFFVFFVLHIVQWLVSSRLRSISRNERS